MSDDVLVVLKRTKTNVPGDKWINPPPSITIREVSAQRAGIPSSADRRMVKWAAGNIPSEFSIRNRKPPTNPGGKAELTLVFANTPVDRRPGEDSFAYVIAAIKPLNVGDFSTQGYVGVLRASFETPMPGLEVIDGMEGSVALMLPLQSSSSPLKDGDSAYLVVEAVDPPEWLEITSAKSLVTIRDGVLRFTGPDKPFWKEDKPFDFTE